MRVTLEQDKVFTFGHDEPFQRRVFHLEHVLQKKLVAQIIDYIELPSDCLDTSVLHLPSLSLLLIVPAKNPVAEMARYLLKVRPALNHLLKLLHFVKNAGFEGAVRVLNLERALLPEKPARDEAFETARAQNDQEDVTNLQKCPIKTAHVPQKVQKVVDLAFLYMSIIAHRNHEATNV